MSQSLRFSTHALLSGLLLSTALLRPLSTAAEPLPPAAVFAKDIAPAPNLDLEEVLRGGRGQRLPGVALAVQQDGEPPIYRTGGLANIEQQTPLKASDRFALYSITKTFTATVVLQLVDEGVLSLDDTVARWLDDPAVKRIPNVDRITLRQLLNHTSGIYDYADDDGPFLQDAFFGEKADWTRVWSPVELLAYADSARHAPYADPGQLAHYSNTGYILLGLIVQQATGHRLADDIRTRILAPLALNDTYMAVDEEIPGGYIAGYQLLDGKLVNVSAINTSWAWAAGGMVSTSADLARFGQAVFAGELLSPNSFEEMFTFVPSRKPGLDEGLGVYRVGSLNGELVGMDGQGAGYVSSLMRLPSAGATVAVLANMAPDEGALDTIRDESFGWIISQTTPSQLP